MIHILSGPTPVIDGNDGEAFRIQLTTDALVNVINLQPGYTYSVEARQDGAGGHALQWLQNIRNGPDINQDPNGTTQMNFICLDDGVGYLSMKALWGSH